VAKPRLTKKRTAELHALFYDQFKEFILEGSSLNIRDTIRKVNAKLLSQKERAMIRSMAELEGVDNVR
jgi:hypothetical protein